MKTQLLTESTLLTGLVSALVIVMPVAHAQSPPNIAGRTIVLTIANGTDPFATVGSFRFLPSMIDSRYAVVPVTGNTEPSTGTYQYTKTGTTTATLTLTDASMGSLNAACTFSSSSGGSYSLTSPNLPPNLRQTGTFVLFAGESPVNIACCIIAVAVTSGDGPYADQGCYRFLPACSANTYDIEPCSANMERSAGTYTYHKNAAYTGSITFTDSSTGAGNSAQLSFDSPTSGTVYLVGGGGYQTATFTMTCCTYALSSTTWSGPAAGGNTAVTVTANGSTCNWMVSNPCPEWLTVTPTSGTGTRNVTVTASGNTSGTQRTCALTIAGQTFNVIQPAASCTFGITPSSWSAPAEGGNTVVRITASGSTCNWTVSNPCPDWLTVTPTSGTGTRNVTITASGNASGSARTCTLIIAGQGFNVTVPASGLSIVTQPVSMVTTQGMTAQFAVTTAGVPPLTYQWLKDGRDLPGVQGTTLILSNVDSWDAGMYVVRVSNLTGATSSLPARLDVVVPLMVSTLAGQPGSMVTLDGTGLSARFNLPTGIGVDGAGNVYVTDFGDHVIRRISREDVVSTWAGVAGSQGSTDGTGSDARFSQPLGVGVDAAGNVYVAEVGNHTVRRITPGRVVSTLAGTARQTGSADGLGANARFNNPRGLTLDTAGNVYLADTLNHTIRRITPTGVVTTVAGIAGRPGTADGPVGQAQFRSPSFLALDASGNLYVTDAGNHTIRKLTPQGVVSTVAGVPGQEGSADGPGNQARFNGPRGLAVDEAGNIVVADFGNHTIRQILPSGYVTTLAGSPTVSGSADGAGTGARFNSPYGVLWQGTGGIYITDEHSSTLRSGHAPEPVLPSLRISRHGGTVRLTWPASAARYLPETVNRLAPNAPWLPTPDAITSVGADSSVTITPAATSAFYRLRHW